MSYMGPLYSIDKNRLEASYYAEEGYQVIVTAVRDFSYDKQAIYIP